MMTFKIMMIFNI